MHSVSDTSCISIVSMSSVSLGIMKHELIMRVNNCRCFYADTEIEWQLSLNFEPENMVILIVTSIHVYMHDEVIVSYDVRS